MMMNCKLRLPGVKLKIASRIMPCAVLAAVVATGGCGVMDCMRLLRRPAAAPVMQSTGRLDSLWNSALPADTLFLAKTPAGAAEALLPAQPPLRRGPSSAEILSPEAVWGWRVQLASSTDKDELAGIVGRVEREFGTAVYLEELEGKYVLRIGAFDNLVSAGRERDRAVSYGYKNTWIVQTRIPPNQIQREE